MGYSDGSYPGVIDPSRIPRYVVDQAMATAPDDAAHAVRLIVERMLGTREAHGMDENTLRITATGAVMAAHPDNRKAHGI